MERTGHRHPAGIPQGPGEVEDPEDSEADDGPDDGARRAVGQGVHADGPRQEMAAHDHDLEDDLGPAEDLLEDAAHADGLSEDLDGVAEVEHVGVRLVELAQDEARVRRQDAHDEDEDDAGHEADGGQDGGQREDAEGDGLGDEDDATLPAVCVSGVAFEERVEVVLTTRSESCSR